MASKRQKMKAKKDQQVFSHTAAKGKKINVYPYVPRGGYRM